MGRLRRGRNSSTGWLCEPSRPVMARLRIVTPPVDSGRCLSRPRGLVPAACRWCLRPRLCDCRGMSEAGDPDEVQEQSLAVGRDVAARIARLSERQVDYWASTGLIKPAVDTSVSPGRRIRLYGFVGLLSLLVAAELKNRKVSLQHIRAIVGHLQARGYANPLTQLAFATVGREVYFMHDDGTWEGGLRPDQVVIHEVLNLAPLRNRITAGARRDSTLAGTVERRRGVMGSKPVLAGTRVPVDTVRLYLEAGRTVEQILESFRCSPHRTSKPFDAALPDLAVRLRPRRRRRCRCDVATTRA